MYYGLLVWYNLGVLCYIIVEGCVSLVSEPVTLDSSGEELWRSFATIYDILGRLRFF